MHFVLLDRGDFFLVARSLLISETHLQVPRLLILGGLALVILQLAQVMG